LTTSWRERAAFPAAVVVVLLLSWWWIAAMALDMYGAMHGASAWMMTGVWDGTHLVLLWTMWAVMMAAMMLPSAWPMLSVYATFSDRQHPGARQSSQLYLFAGGYVFVWALFSVGATLLQRALAAAMVLSPMMALASPRTSAAFLILAGVYQVTPLKRVCLRQCRSPISFLFQYWHPGAWGALRMGAAHGAYCVGCCWALMLLLFAGGVMNLYVIAALTTTVAIEKTSRIGVGASQVSGAVLIALGLWMLR